MILMKEYELILKNKQHKIGCLLSNCLQVLKTYYDLTC